jgi:hypothetical protein
MRFVHGFGGLVVAGTVDILLLVSDQNMAL